MENDFGAEIDAVTRKVLAEQEPMLARAGLTVRFHGLTVRDEVPGVRESDVELWFYRGAALVDSAEVAVERAGDPPPAPDVVEGRLRDALWEVISLHVRARPPRRHGGVFSLRAQPASTAVPAVAPVAPSAPVTAAPPATPPVVVYGAWSPSPYVQRLRSLALKVMAVPPALLSCIYVTLGLAEQSFEIAVLGPIITFAGWYALGFPTAALASLLHTRLMRTRDGRESVPASTLLGGGIGIAAGAVTPWYLPTLTVGEWPLVAATSVIGGVMGAAYGALMPHWHPLVARRPLPRLADAPRPELPPPADNAER
jgi:hypothetical protein